jgi:hypothetical protein
MLDHDGVLLSVGVLAKSAPSRATGVLQVVWSTKIVAYNCERPAVGQRHLVVALGSYLIPTIFQ